MSLDGVIYFVSTLSTHFLERKQQKGCQKVRFVFTLKIPAFSLHLEKIVNYVAVEERFSSNEELRFLSS